MSRDKVQITGASVSGDADIDKGAARVGEIYSVSDFCPADDANNDDPNGRPYWLLDDQYSIGGSHWAYPENVLAIKSSPIPDVAAFARIFSHSLISTDEDEFEAFGTMPSGDTIEVEGRLPDGEYVNVTLRVVEVS